MVDMNDIGESLQEYHWMFYFSGCEWSYVKTFQVHPSVYGYFSPKVSTQQFSILEAMVSHSSMSRGL